MLQRQNLYVAKTKFICYKDKFICYKDKKLYLIKTKFICCENKFTFYKAESICSKDKIFLLYRQRSTVLGLSAPAGGFFPPRKSDYARKKALSE